MIKLNRSSSLLATCALLSVSHIAQAASPATTGFAVTATIEAVCSVSTPSDVAFGTYDTATGSAVSGNTDITLNCTNGTNYEIKLSTGGSGNYTSRRMSDGGTEVLNYNLFTEAALTNIWGDSSGSTQTISGTGNGSSVAHTVFGQITASQTSAPASYTDNIIVTVEYS